MEDEKASESPPYSAAQQKTIRQGLSILAKVAIRAHLRRQAPTPQDSKLPRFRQLDSA